jgi:uracil-DNA glycosylase family 4
MAVNHSPSLNQFNHSSYLHQMGIQTWKSRVSPMDSILKSSQPSFDKGGQINELDWDALQARVEACTACALHEGRTQTVFGVGNRNAELLVVGEAPGATEDKMGLPFVGRAGQLLDSMMFSIGLDREKIYIANVLKSRPPNNRDPLPAEVAQCMPFLLQQIALIQPRLILAVGRIAAHYLLKNEEPMSNLRGKLLQFNSNGRDIPLMVTYHPAYLLRSPREKRKSLIDMQSVAEFLKK